MPGTSSTAGRRPIPHHVLRTRCVSRARCGPGRGSPVRTRRGNSSNGARVQNAEGNDTAALAELDAALEIRADADPEHSLLSEAQALAAQL